MSLRTRLTIYYSGVFLITLLLLSTGIYVAARGALLRGVEEDLRAGTQQMQEIYKRNPAPLEQVIRDGEQLIQVRGGATNAFVIPNLFAQAFSPRGDEVGRSDNLGDVVIQLPQDALSLDIDKELLVERHLYENNVRSLITPMVAVRFNENNIIIDRQLVGFLQISSVTNDVENTLNTLLYILLGGGAAAVILTAGIVAWLSRAALAPIDQVTRTAEGIVRAEDLGRRIPLPQSQDELHRLTVTINGLLARLEMLFTAQRRFIADVSHELRTPLAAMQGNLEVLSRGAAYNPELLQESLTDMRRETTRLTRMVNDLLLLAQSDAGVQLRQEPVELDTLMLEVHRELRPLSRGVTLQIGAEDQVIVTGDRDRLKQALLNLGANALHHTPTGGAVILGLEQRDGYACLSVADTGAGIAADDLPHIFDRFYRADRARSHNVGGAGLGLAIVKRIVEAHTGYVTVASEIGRGSTFAIWLPLAPLATLVVPTNMSVTETVSHKEPVT